MLSSGKGSSWYRGSKYDFKRYNFNGSNTLMNWYVHNGMIISGGYSLKFLYNDLIYILIDIRSKV